MSKSIIVLLLLSLLATGCGSPKPTYPPATDTQDTLEG